MCNNFINNNMANKMKKEFNLSDNIIPEGVSTWGCEGTIEVSDIKEFIKRLKEELKQYLNYDNGLNDVDYIINKLAGEKLK